MALGVLNNLSAIYAENNLNNTNNSLQTVLQQLSSGSRINSGADDAAGLSLVNGLAANSAALTQSETNTTEGVGLLQVADGALSQVTNLLDRAITLATEASNGSLNDTQSAAANQEYQSILSEVNNIGTTTTFNQQQVFNDEDVAIYTGDSSTTGSSIDDLYLRSLSESSVGDSGGVMSYSSGQDNVFLNLSTASANAAVTDTLNSTKGQTTIDVSYLVNGANGEKTTASTQISVGSGTNYANTASGLIQAINDAGLGLTASFATQQEAGVTGGGDETGIEITGGLVSAGFAPSSVSTSGLLNPSGIPASELLTQGQTITVTQNGNTVGTVQINPSINTLQELANAINTGAGTGVTGFTGPTANKVMATVVTNGDGTQSLSLADASASDGTLGVSVTPPSNAPTAPAFGTATAGSSVTVATAGASTAGVQSQPATNASVNVSTAGGDTTAETLTLGTQVTITNSSSGANGTQAITFIVGQGTNMIGAHADTYYTGSMSGVGNLSDSDTGATADTLQGLADAINAVQGTLGATATDTGTSGLTVTTTSAATDESLSVTGNTLTSSKLANQLGLYSPTVAGTTVTNAGTAAVTVIDNGAAGSNTDTMTGSITLTNSYGTYTFIAGSGQDTATTFYTSNHGTDLATYGNLATTINAEAAVTGYGAAYNGTAGTGNKPAIVLTATNVGNNPITVVGTPSLTDTLHAGTFAADAGGTGVTNGTDEQFATSSTAVLQLNSGNLNDATATLGGALSLTFAGNTQVFIIGNQPINGTAVPGAIYTGSYAGANAVAQLVAAINSAGGLGLTATANGGTTGSIYLQGGTGITSAIQLNAVTGGIETPLAVVTSMTSSVLAQGATGQAGNAATNNITAQNNLGQATAVNTNDVMTGQLSIQNNGGSTYTFVVGQGHDTATTFYTDNLTTSTNVGNTLADLALLITDEDGTTGVSAQANTTGLTFTQTGSPGTYTGGSITVTPGGGANALVDVTAGSFSSVTLGTFASENDSVNGTLNFEVGGSDKSLTLNAGSTVVGMINQINSAGLGVAAAWVATSNGFGNVVLTSNTEGTPGNITLPLAALTDTTATANLTYSAGTSYDTGLTSDSTNVVYDSSTGQNGNTAAATFVSDARSGSGIATISYSDGSGQALNGTDLTNANDSETALNELNVAISDVAAQDGYIGAQINTLNSLSQVMSTQQENIVSAQNAVQATDYASATSNMSKYEILSQTGIAALAQANQVQQEVIKLLQ